MAFNEHSSAKLAKIASKGLKDPSSLTMKEIKELAGSVLTQTADRASIQTVTKAVAKKSSAKKAVAKKAATKKR